MLVGIFLAKNIIRVQISFPDKQGIQDLTWAIVLETTAGPGSGVGRGIWKKKLWFEGKKCSAEILAKSKSKPIIKDQKQGQGENVRIRFVTKT